jgi:predicted O-methyltransferase YrrM
MRRELAHHQGNVRRFIVLHDTEIDRTDGESVRDKHDIPRESAEFGYTEAEIARGVWPAIEEFLAVHPEWEMAEHLENNNGLTVLRRLPTVTDHERFIEQAGARYQIVEGSIAVEQVTFFAELLRQRSHVRRILEIGFNGGISASAMLSARADVELVSIDIGHWDCVLKAKTLIDECYPNRHTLIVGDSKTEVPKLDATRPFDMAFVDGNHTAPMPEIDLNNVLPLLVDGGIIVLDDYCETYGQGGVIQAWDKAVKEGKITSLNIHVANLHGWAVGHKRTLHRNVFVVPTCVLQASNAELLRKCVAGIRRCHPEADVVVLNDGSVPELFPDDLDARVECVPDAFLHCGETNAYEWVCRHHAEYDTFVCIHDSAIVVNPIPLELPDGILFRPLCAGDCLHNPVHSALRTLH